MAVGAAAAGTQSEPIGYAIEKEHAIGAHRLRERERARKRSRKRDNTIEALEFELATGTELWSVYGE
ncbi:unnamed protein product, partial [Iphiclides podalirius]